MVPRGTGSHKAMKSIVYGLTIATVVIPSMFGYALIIFADPFFVSYRPVLSKIVILSSAVHQLCFQFMSPLPYAIGQVQDAGLIFLFSIASAITIEMKAEDASDVSILGNLQPYNFVQPPRIHSFLSEQN